MNSKRLLLVDAGNSTVSLAIHDGQQWHPKLSISSRLEATLETYQKAFLDLFPERSQSKIDAIALSSVVPHLNDILIEALKITLEKPIELISTQSDHGIPFLEGEASQELGTDLLANIAACYYGLKKNALIIDFGTALTFMAFSLTEGLKGGIIAPGIESALEGLLEKTALLPAITLEFPSSVLGYNTQQCMQSGLLHGYKHMVNGLIKEIKETLNKEDFLVVSTGGLASLMKPYLPLIDYTDPYLTLEGLRFIAERKFFS